jgi:outer membrane protein assembly factor BamB
MNFKRTKSKLFAWILMLSIAVSAICAFLPNTNAHTPPWNVPTSAYVTCAPDPIGVGQTTTIVVWVDRYSPFAGGGVGQRWDGFTIDITSPSGKTQKIGPFESASDVGSDWKAFTPDEVGTYTIVFSWPGETAKPTAALQSTGSATFDINNNGDFYQGSTSEPYKLTVQTDAVPTWPESPIPTDYWTRPISGANRDWSSLPSNWLLGSWLYQNVQPAGTGPKSPHILWSNPIIPGYPGGLADAQWPDIPVDANDYEGPWSAPIIMEGKIYYNSPAVADSNQYGYYCLDLQNGQQIWYKNGTDNGLNNPITSITGSFGGILPSLSQQYLRLTNGQLYYYYSVNGQGVLAYLWIQSGTTWYMLDATTGNLILTLINVPGGTAATDENGDLLKYSYNANTGTILCWNSSQAIYPGGVTGTGQQQWKPRLGGVIDAVNDTSWLNGTWSASLGQQINQALTKPHSGYTMNVTDASLKNLPGSLAGVVTDNRVPKVLLGTNFPITVNTGSSVGLDYFQAWAVKINDHATDYSPNPGYPSNLQTNLGFTTTLQFSKTIAVPIAGKNYTWSMTGYSYSDDVFCITCKQTGQIWAYSLTTGEQVWGPTTSLPGGPMAFFGVSTNFYNGKCIVNSGYSGQLAAYNAKTGDPLWTYNSTADAPFEAYYGKNMPLSIAAICDGMIYTYSNEHSPTKPLWRDSYLRCINATDGTEMWKLLDFNQGLGLADGNIVTCDEYTNNIYCVGKGPSGLTVDAPKGGIIQGNSFTITGIVTDQSPGAVAYAKKFGLVNGLPAVSDDSQQAFMQYIYEQQIKPTDVKGLPVKIDALDPNGNIINLGTTTSNANGFYSFQVNPDMLTAGSGTYQVIATFAGSNSYGSSNAESAFTINSAATVAPTAIPQSNLATTTDLMAYILGAAIAIIIAIAIVGALILRKRK